MFCSFKPKTGQFQNTIRVVVNFVRSQKQSVMAICIETIIFKANKIVPSFTLPPDYPWSSKGAGVGINEIIFSSTDINILETSYRI